MQKQFNEEKIALINSIEQLEHLYAKTKPWPKTSYFFKSWFKMAQGSKYKI